MRQDARKIDLAAFNERSELPPSFPNPASKHAFYARTLQVDPLSNIDRNILSGVSNRHYSSLVPEYLEHGRVNFGGARHFKYNVRTLPRAGYFFDLRGNVHFRGIQRDRPILFRYA
jgi:hypothetical protein